MKWLKRWLLGFRYGQSIITLKPNEKLVIWLTVREGYEVDPETAEQMLKDLTEELVSIGLKDQVIVIWMNGYERPDFVKRLSL